MNGLIKIKNSGEVLIKLRSRGFHAASLSTYDLSTLYTTLHHNSIKNASINVLKLKIFSWEIPNPPYERKQSPSRALPLSCLRHSGNAFGVPWPDYFSKAEDGRNVDSNLLLNKARRNLNFIVANSV